MHKLKWNKQKETTNTYISLIANPHPKHRRGRLTSGFADGHDSISG